MKKIFHDKSNSHNRDLWFFRLILVFVIFASVSICGVWYVKNIRNAGMVRDVGEVNVGQVKNLEKFKDIKVANIKPYFIKNDGQLPKEYLFYWEQDGKSVYFTKQGLSITNIYSKKSRLERKIGEDNKDDDVIISYQQNFVNYNDEVEIGGNNKRETLVNYYVGDVNLTGIPTYDEVIYKNIYPGIDAIYKFQELNGSYTFKSDYVVSPGADPKLIDFNFVGLDNLGIDNNGNLEIEIDDFIYKQKAPYIYQLVNGGMETVRGDYMVADFDVGFSINDYDKTQKLIIDPVFIQLTASGTVTDCDNQAVKLSADGNFVYVVGEKLSTYDVCVLKYTSNLSSLALNTTYGGTGDDWGQDVALDSLGNLYITGITYSSDLPDVTGCYDATYDGGGADAFIVKFVSSTLAVSKATYIGGIGEDYGRAIDLDSSNNVYITGHTASASGIASGGYDTSQNGNNDAFISKLDSNLTASYVGTYFGGTAHDIGYDIDISGTSVYIVGSAASTAGMISGGWLTTNQGDQDGFVAKFNTALTTHSASSYVGRARADQAHSLKISANGNVVVMGYSVFDAGATNIDTMLVAFPSDLSSPVVKYISDSGKQSYQQNYFGDITTDVSDNIYLVSQTTGNDLATQSGVYDTSFNGGTRDGFLYKIAGGLSGSASHSIISSYIGSTNDSYGDMLLGIDLDSSGNAFVVGYNDGTNFPAGSGGFVARFNNVNVAPTATISTPSQNSASSVRFTSLVTDLDMNDVTLFVDYSLDGGSTWTSSTIGAVSGDTVTTSTGQINGIIGYTDGITMTIDWNLLGIVIDTSTTKVRLTPYDGIVNGTATTSANFSMDTVPPTAPGALATSTISSSSVVLTFGSTSTETNFLEYKIFYKVGSSGVTESDTAFTSSSDVHLGSVTFSGFTTTSISGLSPDTQYVFNIWAYDTYGNKSFSAQELVFYTLAETPSVPTVTNISYNSMDIAIGSDSNSASTEYVIKDLINIRYVQFNGTIGIPLYWATKAIWGTKNVTGLSGHYNWTVKARNSDGIETSYGPATSTYTITQIPNQPIVTSTATSTLNITITASGAYSYLVHDSVTNKYLQFDKTWGTVSSTGWMSYADLGFGSPTTTRGLLANTLHTIEVMGQNGNGYYTVYGPSSSVYTLAETPIAPTVNSPTVTTLDVTIGTDGNPAITEYAIQEVNSGNYVQTNGSLGVSAVWNTSTGWGTKPVTGLTASTSYSFKIKARNGDNVETSLGPTTTLSTLVNVVPVISNLVLTPFFDGSHYVSINTDVSDANNENVKLKIEYSATPCDYSEPTPQSTLINVTASSGTPTTSSDPYQVLGITTVSTNSVTSTWNSNDITSADGTYCVYVTPNDGTEDGVIVSSTVVLDNNAPTGFGILAVNTTTVSSVVINFGTPAIDIGGHFDQYKIFYKLGSSGVVESDVPPNFVHTSSSDSHLGSINYGGAVTTTISGLSANSQYVMRIWAYDTYGNKTAYTAPLDPEFIYPDETTFFTLAPTPTNLTTSSLATSSASFSVDAFDNANTGSSGYYFSVIKVSDLSEIGNSGWQSDNNTWGITSLLPYTNYRVSVIYRNGIAVETSPLTYDFTTLDIIPLVPAITSITSTLPTNLNFILSPDGNVTSSITFLIHDSTENKYLQADGTWGVGEVWHTYDALGAEVGTSTTGLLPNTQHTIEAKAKSGSGELTVYGSSLGIYTLANTPGAPTLTASSTSVINLVIDVNSNSASTTYFICQTIDNSSCSADGYVQASGALGASAIWRTYSAWGGALGTDVSGLLTNASYKFLTEARNGNNTETALSAVSSETYTLTTVPSGVVAAKDNVNNTSQINVFWDTSSSTAYQVGYGTASWLINPTNSTAWDTPLYSYISGLTANSSYYFRVRARNGNSSTTEWSGEVSASTDSSAPPLCNGCGSNTEILNGTVLINSDEASTTERNISLSLTTNGNGYYGPVEAIYNSVTGQFGACDFAGQQSHTISASAQVNFALTATTGTKKICVRFINSAGSTLEASDEIILMPVVEVLNGTIMINGDVTSTTNPMVSLSLTTNATGYYGPVEAVYNSSTQQFSDCDYSGLTANSISISAQTTFILSSTTGTKKICIKYVSDAGTSLERSANIILNEAYVDPTKNLLVHLTFDTKNSANSFTDYSVNNFKVECVTSTCPATLEQGLRGQAAAFDGVDDTIYIKANPKLNITKEVSMVAWIKPEPTNSETNENMWIASKVFDYELIMTKSGLVSAGVRNQALKRIQARSSNNFSMQKWNQIALTFDGQKVRLFINGKLISEIAQTGPIAKTVYDFRIGAFPSGKNFMGRYHGLIDDLKLYDYALTGEEIETDYLLSPAIEYIGPVYFDFETPIVNQLTSDKADKFLARCLSVNVCPQSVPGKFGNGFFFDGKDDRLDILNSSGYNGQDGITIEAWVKPMTDVLTTNTRMLVFTKNLNYELTLFRNNGVVRGGIKSVVDGSLKYSDSKSGALKMNDWNHVAMSYDGKNVKTFINGAIGKQINLAMATPGLLRLAGLAEGGIGISPNTSNLTIGNNSGNSFPFRGIIDSLVFYPYTLSDTEIIAHFTTSTDIIDSDKDGIKDTLDNCPSTPNPDQLDTDKNGQGDACDPCPLDFVDDNDNDKICSGSTFTSPMTAGSDNCPINSNSDQKDSDTDKAGDVCDVCPQDLTNDSDNDKVCSGTGFSSPMTKDNDNCPLISNLDQLDSDNDKKGNACDTCPNDSANDSDSDTFCANIDNCPLISNPDQLDSDNDKVGNVCDTCPDDFYNDIDHDNLCASVDSCPFDPKNDEDRDSLCANNDSCPLDANNDIDHDGVCGNVDVCPTDPTNQCNVQTCIGSECPCIGSSCPLPSCIGSDCPGDVKPCVGIYCQTCIGEGCGSSNGTTTVATVVTDSVVNSILANESSLVNIVNDTLNILADILPGPVGDFVQELSNSTEDLKKVVQEEVLNNPQVEQATRQIAPVLAVAGVANVAVGFGLPEVIAFARSLFTQPLLMLRRRKQKSWGVIYDSFTKQPLDLATIRVINATTKQIVRSQVTDSRGRYYLMLEPGTYQLQIQKNGYNGLSDYLRGLNEDANYINLYHGENIIIDQSNTALNYNIPLDATSKKASPKDILKDKFGKYSHYLIGLIGVISSGVSLAIEPTPIISGFFFTHLFFFGISYQVAYKKMPMTSFGQATDKETKMPIDHAIVHIFDSEYNKLVASTLTDEQGRYALLVGPARYYVTFDKPGFASVKSDIIDLSSQKTQGMGGMITVRGEMEKEKRFKAKVIQMV